MPLSHQKKTEIRSRGGKKNAKVAMKCNNFYDLGDYNNNRQQTHDNNTE